MTDPASALPPSHGPVWRADGRTERPALDASTEADVVVVGGGIAGLTTALLLARDGVEVVVLEARHLGAGTTGHTSAKVSALQATRMHQIRSAHGPAVAAAYAAAQVDAHGLMGDLVTDLGIACDWEERPAATVAMTPDQRSAVEQEAAAASDAGLPVRLIESCEDLPFETHGAVVLDGQHQFDPQRYLDGLAAAAVSTGRVRIHEHARVVDVDAGPRSLVRTEGGSEVRAGTIVVTTLLPILDRGLHFATSEPVGSSCLTVDVDGPLPDRMYISAGDPTRSLRTVAQPGGRLLLVGGSGHRVGTDEPERNQAELARWAATRYPVRAVTHRWFAHDQAPADHLPWAGPLARNDRLLGAGGFAKWGMTNGTAAAAVLASRILGSDAPAWSSVFEPHRRSRAGVRGMAHHNATTAAEMAKGWLDPRRPKVVCTHLGGICRRNEADETWDCPLHGSRFADDGTVVAAPAVRPAHTPDGVRKPSSGRRP